ncbi:MAG: hypothetical protein KDA61_03370, partial [Planctomycetales bacterium]|nr:hypothetical protein [Planctomycetales bacterium]
LVACAGLTAKAGVLEDFPFNDADGTGLAAATNVANPGNQWVEDTDHAASIQVQGGALHIEKNDTNFVTEGLEIADVATGKLWLVADFAGWSVLGQAPDSGNVEEIRFGFNSGDDLIPPPSSTVLAEMQLKRDFDANAMVLTGVALGGGGTSLGDTIVNMVQDSPFTMVLAIDQDTDTYEVLYRDGAAAFASAGSGALEPTRDALIVRFTVNNFWGDVSGEFADLDRVYVTDVDPTIIPEPTSLALWAGASLILVRRRRS